jgi:hypothetical protein
LRAAVICSPTGGCSNGQEPDVPWLACLLPCHPGARCSGGCVDGQRNESRQNQTSIQGSKSTTYCSFRDFGGFEPVTDFHKLINFILIFQYTAISFVVWNFDFGNYFLSPFDWG